MCRVLRTRSYVRLIPRRRPGPGFCWPGAPLLSSHPFRPDPSSRPFAGRELSAPAAHKEASHIREDVFALTIRLSTSLSLGPTVPSLCLSPASSLPPSFSSPRVRWPLRSSNEREPSRTWMPPPRRPWFQSLTLLGPLILQSTPGGIFIAYAATLLSASYCSAASVQSWSCGGQYHQSACTHVR